MGSKRLSTLILSALLLLAVLGTAAQLMRHGDKYSHSVFELGYGFGGVAKNLAEGNGYLGDTPLPRSAHRLPLIPLFLWTASAVTTQLWFAWLVKNLLVFGLSGWALARLVVHFPPRDKERLLLAASLAIAFFLPPGNLFLLTAIDFEEGFLAHFFLAAFAILLLPTTRNRMIGLALLLAAAYLTKSSVAPAVGLLAIAAVLKARGSAFSWAPLAAVFIAAVGWGSFTLSKTGHFAIGATSSSWNGQNLRKGNNDLFHNYYPTTNLDYMAPETWGVDEPYETEWELDALQAEDAKQWIREHPREFGAAVVKRADVAFLTVLEAPAEGERGVDWEMVLNRLIFLGAIGVAMSQALWRRRVALLFLAFAVVYAAPYLLAFIYHRHMIPVYAVSVVFLLFSLGQQAGQRQTS